VNEHSGGKDAPIVEATTPWTTVFPPASTHHFSLLGSRVEAGDLPSAFDGAGVPAGWGDETEHPIPVETLRSAAQNQLRGVSVDSYIDPREVLRLLDTLAEAERERDEWRDICGNALDAKDRAEARAEAAVSELAALREGIAGLIANPSHHGSMYDAKTGKPVRSYVSTVDLSALLGDQESGR
jgi:hypothetical protein